MPPGCGEFEVQPQYLAPWTAWNLTIGSPESSAVARGAGGTAPEQPGPDGGIHQGQVGEQ